MKRIILLAILGMLVLSGCSVARHKLSPLANVNLKSANNYYNLKNYTSATEYYNMVLKENPDHAPANRRIADINYTLGTADPSRAVDFFQTSYQYYDKAIKVMKEYPNRTDKEEIEIKDMERYRESSWVKVMKAAEAQASAGNTMEAIRIYDIVVAMDTTRVQPLLKLWGIYQKDLKDEAKAEEILLKIYNRDQKNPEIQMNMGIFYLNKKDYQTAIPFFLQVRESELAASMNQLEPKEYAINLWNLAESYFQLEQFTEAKQANLDAMTKDPRNPDLIAQASDIAVKLNDFPQAIVYLEQLLDIREDKLYYEAIMDLLLRTKNYSRMITIGRKWHAFDDKDPTPVRFVILAASETKNKALQTEFENKLKSMN